MFECCKLHSFIFIFADVLMNIVPDDVSICTCVDEMAKFASELSNHFCERGINSSICITLVDKAVSQVVMKRYSVDSVEPTKKYPSIEFLCSGISANFVSEFL